MKNIFTTVFIGIVGFILVSSVLTTPVNKELVPFVFNLIWSIGAIVLGLYATFFSKKLNLRNANRFEKLAMYTHLSFLKKMAMKTKTEDQYIVTKGVGTIFLLTGLIMLFRYLMILIGFYG